MKLRKKDSGLKKLDADEIRAAAKRRWARSDCEIDFDDDPPISYGGPEAGGCYVQAWVWVAAPDIEKPESLPIEGHT